MVEMPSLLCIVLIAKVTVVLATRLVPSPELAKISVIAGIEV